MLLRRSGSTVYVSVAAATAATVCLAFIGFGLRHRSEGNVMMAVLLAIPVVGGFLVGAWRGARRRPWLDFREGSRWCSAEYLAPRARLPRYTIDARPPRSKLWVPEILRTDFRKF